MFKNHAVKYYDFMNDSIFRDNDFYDPDHLSDVGASRLSLVLADSLKSSFTKNANNNAPSRKKKMLTQGHN